MKATKVEPLHDLVLVELPKPRRQTTKTKKAGARRRLRREDLIVTVAAAGKGGSRYREPGDPAPAPLKLKKGDRVLISRWSHGCQTTIEVGGKKMMLVEGRDVLAKITE